MQYNYTRPYFNRPGLEARSKSLLYNCAAYIYHFRFAGQRTRILKQRIPSQVYKIESLAMHVIKINMPKSICVLCFLWRNESNVISKSTANMHAIHPLSWHKILYSTRTSDTFYHVVRKSPLCSQIFWLECAHLQAQWFLVERILTPWTSTSTPSQFSQHRGTVQA